MAAGRSTIGEKKNATQHLIQIEEACTGCWSQAASSGVHRALVTEKRDGELLEKTSRGGKRTACDRCLDRIVSTAGAVSPGCNKNGELFTPILRCCLTI